VVSAFAEAIRRVAENRDLLAQPRSGVVNRPEEHSMRGSSQE
jgi:hypothetical protein